jgi:hypothetical protein
MELLNLQALRQHTKSFLHQLRQSNDQLGKHQHQHRPQREPSIDELNEAQRKRWIKQRKQEQQDLALYMQTLRMASPGDEAAEAFIPSENVPAAYKTFLEDLDDIAASNAAKGIPVPPSVSPMQDRVPVNPLDQGYEPRLSSLYEQRRETQERSLSPIRLPHSTDYRSRRSKKQQKDDEAVGKFGLHATDVRSLNGLIFAQIFTLADFTTG